MTRAGSGGRVSSFVPRNLDGVTKISRELTAAPRVGGPARTAASVRAEAGDTQGLVKIDGTLSLGSLRPTFQT